MAWQVNQKKVSPINVKPYYSKQYVGCLNWIHLLDYNKMYASVTDFSGRLFIMKINFTLLLLETEYSGFGVNTMLSDALAPIVPRASADMDWLCGTDSMHCCSRENFMHLDQANFKI